MADNNKKLDKYVYITKCENQECEKKDNCLRFKLAKGITINFANICNSKTDYRWFWEIKSKI